MLHLNPCLYVCYVIRRCLGLFVSVITELTVLQTDFDGLSAHGPSSDNPVRGVRVSTRLTKKIMVWMARLKVDAGKFMPWVNS